MSAPITFFFIALIHLSLYLSTQLGDRYQLIALAVGVSLIWLGMSCERIERKLYDRRVWVSQALNPTSWFYRFLWGGSIFSSLQALLVLPLTVILFVHLARQSMVEWFAIYLITILSLRWREVGAKKLRTICSPFFETEKGASAFCRHQICPWHFVGNVHRF